MGNESAEIAKFSPYKLVQDYAETPVWKYAAIAIVIHVVVIGATSVRYLANLGKEPQAAAAQPAGGTAQPAPTGAATPTVPTPGPTTGTAPTPASATPTAATGEAALMEQHKDTKIIQAITETASPDEIPQAPDDLGISIKDTERPKK